MYHEITDKEFLGRARCLCGEIMQALCLELKENYDMGCCPILVGSGARNLILQNENEPIDLDYNLEIRRNNYNQDPRTIKIAVQNAFDKVLSDYGLENCEDSTSCLTTKKISFSGNLINRFSLDVAIVCRNNKGNWQRLIHDKHLSNHYFWNEAPNSKDIERKVKVIKSRGEWQSVRKMYIDLKNDSLSIPKYNRKPSFILYIEAVNNIYNHLNQMNRSKRKK